MSYNEATESTREAVTMKKTMIGYQVYSAREDAAKDLLGTLKALKAMG